MKNKFEYEYIELKTPQISIILNYQDYKKLSKNKGDAILNIQDFNEWGNDSIIFVNAFLANTLFIKQDLMDLESPWSLNQKALYSIQSNKYGSLFYLRKALVALIDFQYDKIKDINNSIFNSLKNNGNIDFGNGTINIDSFDPITLRDLVPNEFWFYMKKGRILKIFREINPGYESQLTIFINKCIDSFQNQIDQIYIDQEKQNQQILLNQQKNDEQDIRITKLEMGEGIAEIGSQLVENFEDDSITNQVFLYENEEINNHNNIDLTIKKLDSNEYSSLGFDYLSKPNIPIYLNFNGMANPIIVVYMSLENKVSITIPTNFALKQIIFSSSNGINSNSFNFTFNANKTNEVIEYDPLSIFYELNQQEINSILKNEIGELEDLPTENKSDIVSSILEMNQKITSLNSTVLVLVYSADLYPYGLKNGDIYTIPDEINMEEIFLIRCFYRRKGLEGEDSYVNGGYIDYFNPINVLGQKMYFYPSDLIGGELSIHLSIDNSTITFINESSMLSTYQIDVIEFIKSEPNDSSLKKLNIKEKVNKKRG